MIFAITGLGRSGSKSLAQQLSLNTNGYKVHHERDNHVLDSPKPFADRIKQNYGEVSGYLRRIITRLTIGKTAVILRDPRAIYNSAMQRSHGKNPQKLIDDMSEGLKYIDYAIEQGTKIIYFCDMISSEEYRQKEIYDWLGLDVPEGFPWIDKSPEKNRYGCSAFVWFNEKYHLWEG